VYLVAAVILGRRVIVVLLNAIKPTHLKITAI
jgi:hypothetical protein